jgi:hypothetical protein
MDRGRRFERRRRVDPHEQRNAARKRRPQDGLAFPGEAIHCESRNRQTIVELACKQERREIPLDTGEGVDCVEPGLDGTQANRTQIDCTQVCGTQVDGYALDSEALNRRVEISQHQLSFA